MIKNLETCLEREAIQGAKQCLFDMLQLFRKVKPENLSDEEFNNLFSAVDDVLLTIDNEMAVSKDFVIAENHELALSEAYSEGFKDGKKYALETADH